MSKVILPRKPNAPDASERQPAGPHGTGTGEHSERILLLEDEEQTNLVLKEYLQSFGYRVVAVANGVDGLREVIKSDFELVICDMMMPKLPGDMFYLAVQKTRPKLCGRFVFITGHQGTPQIEAFIARTQAAILVKPFRLQQLEIALRGVLSRAAKKEEAAAPLRIVPNQHFPKEQYSRSSKLEPVPAPTDKMPSMVAKALKLVGFMRKEEKAAPSAAGFTPGVPQRDAPRPTRRIPPQSGQITRRIPHLASTPIPARPMPLLAEAEPPRRITRRIAQASTPPPFPAKSEPPVVEAREKTPEPVPALPPEPVRSPKVEHSLTLRVKDQTPEARPTASLTRITRKISDPKPSSPAAKVSRSIPKTAPVAPKTTRTIAKVTRPVPTVTREIPKVTRPVAKVTRAIPKVTRPVAKVTREIPKVTRSMVKETKSIPKVTIRVQRDGQKITTAKAAPKVTLKVVEKAEAPKVTRTVVSRRIKSEKK